MTLPQRLVEREGAVGGAGDRDALDVNARQERGERLVVAQLSARLGVKMDGRRPAARQQQRVGRPGLPADPDALHARGADDALDLEPTRNAKLCRGSLGSRVENLDLGAGFAQRLGDRIGAVVVGRDRDALADEDGEAAEIDERGVGRHHPRTIVVGDDQRPLDRAGRHDDPFRPDAPKRVGERAPALPGADEIVVVDAEGGRRRHHPSAVRLDRGADACRPAAPVAPFDRAAAVNELPADVVAVVDEEHDATELRSRLRRGEAGRALRRRRARRSAH